MNRTLVAALAAGLVFVSAPAAYAKRITVSGATYHSKTNAPAKTSASAKADKAKSNAKDRAKSAASALSR